jgi:Spy/CpxP family protein refolding chaperone
MPIQKNALLPLVVAGGLVAAVAVAVAGGDDEPKPEKVAKVEPRAENPDGADIPARHKSQLCRRLQCTTEQDEPVYELIVEHREEAKLRAKESKTARRKVAELYAADEVDEEALRAVYGEIAEAEGKVQLQAYESIVTLHSLLSPEQRATLGKMLARTPPEELLGRPGRDKDAPRDKGRASARRGRGDAAPKLDPADHAARAEAARARRAAAGERRDAAIDPAAARRALADKDAAGDAGLQ